nr:hypothetical protein [Tanacetum cinerariifolium]
MCDEDVLILLKYMTNFREIKVYVEANVSLVKQHMTKFGIDCDKIKEKLSQDSVHVEEVVEHVTDPVMYEDVLYEDVAEQMTDLVIYEDVGDEYVVEQVTNPVVYVELGFSKVVEGLGDPTENEVMGESKRNSSDQDEIAFGYVPIGSHRKRK